MSVNGVSVMAARYPVLNNMPATRCTLPIGSPSVSIALFSHSSENPCTRDHAASAAACGSSVARGIVEGADTCGQFGAGRSLSRHQFGVVRVDERPVEHDRVVARMVEREPDISQRGVDEIRPRAGERCGQLPPALGRQRGEQAAPIGEVVRGRGMRDACHPRQFAQRDPVGAALGHQVGRLREDDGLQVAVVVRRPAHPAIIAEILTAPRLALTV